MPLLKFGIVGCGHIARMHAEGMASLPRVQLAAACDTDPLALQSFVRSYRVRGYNRYTELLGEKDLDVIVICTPSGLHAGMGVLAAKAGKHVLVEKPMALTLEDADRMIEACEKEGVLLSVVLQNRFKPVFQRLKSAITEGSFGKLSHAGATVRWNRDAAYFCRNPWRGKKDQDGGVVMNQAIHSIDMLYWLLGEVKSVFAYTATRYRPIEAEDVGVAVLQFENGALGVLEAASTVYPRNLEETIAVFGEEGTVVIGGVKAVEIKTWDFLAGQEADRSQQVRSTPANGRYAGHQAVLEDLVNSITTGERLRVDGREGEKALEIVLGIYRSSATGMPVPLPLAPALRL